MRKNIIQNAEKSFKLSLLTVAVIYTLIFLFASCVTQKQRERILKRGERLDTQYPGQGIGTAVVKDIIDSYGGQLFVEESALGGAQFRVIFPLNHIER